MDLETLFSINWKEFKILPQPAHGKQVIKPTVSDPVEYSERMIELAGCTERASMLEVMIEINNMFRHELKNRLIPGAIQDGIMGIYDQLLCRADYDYKMLFNSLSYFGEEGIIIGEELAELLVNEIPTHVVTLIQEGRFDKILTGPSNKLNWSQDAIEPQNAEVPNVASLNLIEYSQILIRAANRVGYVSPILFGTDLQKFVKMRLEWWANQADMDSEVINMFDQISMREDFNFQMVLNGLSYFGLEGLMVAEEVKKMLEVEGPPEFVEIIREGRYDLF